MKTVTYLILGLIILCIFVLGFLILKSGANNNSTPNDFYIIKLTNNNTTPVIVEVYVNASLLESGNVSIKGGETSTVELSALNPRTNKLYSKDEINSIELKLSTGANLSFSGVNLPKWSGVLSPNLSGISPRNVPISGTTWTKSGYYVLNLEK